MGAQRGRSIFKGQEPLEVEQRLRPRHRFPLFTSVQFFVHQGQHYVAALSPDIQGIRIAKLAWVPDVVAEED